MANSGVIRNFPVPPVTERPPLVEADRRSTPAIIGPPAAPKHYIGTSSADRNPRVDSQGINRPAHGPTARTMRQTNGPGAPSR
jgi:hypothetical protein